MDHTLRAYLARQSTKTLEMLLQQYEEAGSDVATYTALLIRNILKQRKAAGNMESRQ